MKMVNFTTGFFKPQKQQTIQGKNKIRTPKMHKKKYFKGEFIYNDFLPSVQMKEITIKWKDTQSRKSAFSDLFLFA